MGKKKETAAPASNNATPKTSPALKPAKEPKAAEKEEKPETNGEEEDPPIIKELKKLDDEYLAIEREYEKKMMELQRLYNERQEPLLKKRLDVLTCTTKAEKPEDEKFGTPALKDFWLTALSNLPATQDEIEDWDRPVLEYLRDITKEHIDPEDGNKGFRLKFTFVENPFFTNTELVKEYITNEASPYTGEIETTEIKATEIDWKEGQNVTVELVKKKPKGGGAKKKNKAKEKEEPRDSFFRSMFRNLKQDMETPDDVLALMPDDEEEDEDSIVDLLMENDYEIGCSIRDQLIPFAVRWFTGEACEDDDDDGEDSEEEISDDEDEDDDEDDDDEDDTPKPKRGAKKPAGKGAKSGDAGDPKECKQQ